MSFNAQTVTSLRKEGKLQEALSMAAELMKTDPDNIWNRRAVAWVGIEFLKELHPQDQKIGKWITKLCNLALPKDDNLFWEQFQLRTGKILFTLAGVQDAHLGWLEFFLEALPEVANRAHSFLLGGILKSSSTRSDFPALMNAWGWDGFLTENNEQEKLPNGKSAPTLKERAYNAVAKWYLDSNEESGSTMIEMHGK